jgi:hypothetical protein
VQIHGIDFLFVTLQTKDEANKGATDT